VAKMNSVQTWGEAITLSLMEVWGRFVGFFPALIGALLVFIFGLVAAIALGKVAERIIRITHIDQALEKIRAFEHFKKAGVDISLSKFSGELVKWFLVLVFLMAATDILGLVQVTYFLNNIILYIPNIVVATIILSIAFLLGNFVYTIVRGSTRVAGVVSAAALALISKWSIIVFGLLAALIQLGIATSLVNTIFIGIVAAFSLAIGLAFGLGGRDEAALMLRKFREEMTEKK